MKTKKVAVLDIGSDAITLVMQDKYTDSYTFRAVQEYDGFYNGEFFDPQGLFKVVSNLISECEKVDIAIEAVELLESGMKTLCTAVIGVLANRENRINRIMIRDAMSRADAEKRIDAQRNDGYYISRCDRCVENNGTVEELGEKILSLVKEIDTQRFSSIARNN